MGELCATAKANGRRQSSSRAPITTLDQTKCLPSTGTGRMGRFQGGFPEWGSSPLR